VRRATAALGAAEMALARAPADRYLAVNVRSLQREVSEVEESWLTTAEKSRVDLIKYRLVPDFSEHFGLSDFAKSLLGFQDLFLGISKSVIRKQMTPGDKRKRLEIPEFEFAYSYPGSLGVVLLMDSDAVGSRYDDAISTILKLPSLHDTDDIRDIAQYLGRPVVNRVYDWSKTNYDARFSVDMSWKFSDGRQLGNTIATSEFARIVSLIGGASDIDVRTIETRGVLIGIDSKTRRFRFVDPQGGDFHGQINQEFHIADQWTINSIYWATIRETSSTNYATDETKLVHELISLQIKKSE
ncbi:MAG: hypothetical protein ACRYG4_08950, partial [Janthinobacterium lividum]